jgi:opacity protein-like surface antigen
MNTPHVTGLAAAALALTLATPARAQYEPPRFQVGGGAIVPAGAITDRFETGWQLAGGVGWKLVHETLAIRLDYDYSRERLIGGALSAGFVNGEHQIHSLEADLEWTVTPGSPDPVYLLAGPGVYLQQTSITNLRDYTPGPPICVPWLQVCSPGPVSPEEILGSRSSTNLGFNLGAGVDIPIHGRVAAFVEVRWRFVWGSAYGLPGGSEHRATGNYFPLTLGVRF